MCQNPQAIISIPSSFETRLDAVARLMRGLAQDFKAYKAGAIHYRSQNVRKDQEWFWSDEWQAMEREADEALARGEYKDFDTVEELITDLDF